MKLVSIDIETTGLDPDNCQILEFAAVCFDPQPALINDETKEPIRDRPRWQFFERLIRHDKIVGQPFALSMNSEILAEISGRSKTHRKIIAPWELSLDFGNWLEEQGFNGGNRVYAAGKNYGSFDLQFLKRLEGWSKLPFNHRSLDVGSLCFNPVDGEIPSLKKCLEIIGTRKEISHRAIDDARDVATVVTQFFSG